MPSCLHAQHHCAPVAQAPRQPHLPSSASYLRRFVPSPFFVLSDTCCLRMLSSSALRSLPGQAQIRASKHRRPKTCPLERERGEEKHQLASWTQASSSPRLHTSLCVSTFHFPVWISRMLGNSHLQRSKKYPIAPETKLSLRIWNVP